LDGSSITRLLREPGAQVESTVFAEMSLKTRQPGFMIRHGDYKYCFYVNDMDELYDLRADPKEMMNLALLPQYREKRDDLKRQLFAWYQPQQAVG
jgi:choline-sulfatase